MFHIKILTIQTLLLALPGDSPICKGRTSYSVELIINSSRDFFMDSTSSFSGVKKVPAIKAVSMRYLLSSNFQFHPPPF